MAVVRVQKTNSLYLAFALAFYYFDISCIRLTWENWRVTPRFSIGRIPDPVPESTPAERDFPYVKGSERVMAAAVVDRPGVPAS